MTRAIVRANAASRRVSIAIRRVVRLGSRLTLHHPEARAALAQLEIALEAFAARAAEIGEL